MKKIIFLIFITAAVLVFSGCATTPVSQVLPSVIIVNETGYSFVGMYLSPVTTDSWEENIIEGSYLPSGQSVSVTLAYPLSKENRYDFLMIDGEEDGYLKLNVLITDRISLVFTMDDFIGKNYLKN